MSTPPWETKRPPTNSVEEQTRIAEVANKPIHPPSNVPMEPRDLPFFASVIDEFAKADWTPHQLELAAVLAKSLSDLVFEQDMLRKEGSIAYSEKGTPVVNPRKAIVQMYAGTILAMRRSLSLHALAGSSKKQEGNRKAAAAATQAEIQSAVEAAEAFEEDSLLAGHDA